MPKRDPYTAVIREVLVLVIACIPLIFLGVVAATHYDVAKDSQPAEAAVLGVKDPGNLADVSQKQILLVGCSQTTNTRIFASGQWPTIFSPLPTQVGYGGGDLAEWYRELKNPSGNQYYWGVLEGDLEYNYGKYDVAIFQLCVLDKDRPSLDEAKEVLYAMKEILDPRATFYIMPLAVFNNELDEDPSNDTCEKQTVEYSQYLYSMLVGDDFWGAPSPPVVFDKFIDDSGCHMIDSWHQKNARNLMKYFGRRP